MPTLLASSSVAGGGVVHSGRRRRICFALDEAFELPSHDRRAMRPSVVCCECLLMVCWDGKRVAATAPRMSYADDFFFFGWRQRWMEAEMMDGSLPSGRRAASRSSYIPHRNSYLLLGVTFTP